MATINVTTTNDILNPSDGVTSLREAITQAGATGEDDTILLDPGQTYRLSLTEPFSSKVERFNVYEKGGKLTISAVGGQATIDGAGRVGGIFHVWEEGNLELNNLVITGSNTYDNNGKGTINVENTAKLKLQSCIVTDNRSSGDTTIISNAGELTVFNSTIKNNIIEKAGGAISNFNINDRVAKALISDSTISNNRSLGIGAGITNAGGQIDIINSTISNNVAEGKIPPDGATLLHPDRAGGAGILNSVGGNINIKSSTITGNWAPGATGIWNLAVGTPSYISLNNTIVAGNIGGQEIVNDTQTVKEQPGVASAITSQGNNLIGNATGVENIFTAPGDQKGTATSPLNPQLAPLANNGGPTQTHALLAGSPAINKGSSSSPLKDQRGISRVGQPDIGAYEYDILTNPGGGFTPPPPIGGRGENVTRFWDRQTGGHFYTTKDTEVRDRLNNPGRYQYEGNEFDAPLPGTPGTLPVYRYLNRTSQTYFYTVQPPVELIAQFPVFSNDGIAFYAYKDASSAPAGTVPIHRFYNNDASARSRSPVHFFTGNEANKQLVMNTFPGFKYEAAGFYDFPKDYVV